MPVDASCGPSLASAQPIVRLLPEHQPPTDGRLRTIVRDTVTKSIKFSGTGL
jgi:hypothetical protein